MLLHAEFIKKSIESLYFSLVLYSNVTIFQSLALKFLRIVQQHNLKNLKCIRNHLVPFANLVEITLMNDKILV